MAMVCPQCKGSFEQHLNCPTCGVRLLFQAHFSADPSPSGEEGGQWEHTPWGRLLVGLVLAQGLAYGLQLLFTAGLMATSEEGSRTVWGTLFGILLSQGLQGFSLIVGGAICGAGQHRGFVYGAFLGMINSIIFVVAQRAQGEALADVALYGQPVIQMVFGALGGLLGSLVWKPFPTVSLPAPSGAAATRQSVVSGSSFNLLEGPVHWGRIIAGIAIVVGGVVWSHVILDFVLEAGQGKLSIKSHLQAKLVGWEISAVAALLGSGVAGATTINGLKQGICVGLGAAVVFAGIHLGSPKAILETTVFLVGSTFCLSLAGGWFGAQLFPPVVSSKRRRIHSAASW
jgi:hypothetical protein